MSYVKALPETPATSTHRARSAESGSLERTSSTRSSASGVIVTMPEG